ncbi:glucosamine-6-phosphate isomerase [Gemella sp. GH3]|uniref:6-phosphogluconolactonase n=1 Tax=unclassified Gemella TaxID=2624949 RepID=UPI0015CFE02D|nr:MULTISPECIES: glucosamine-6-phosphate isomerase [unclassified Gemella]MBF0713777.1 glucosamine-6-phosphate isomerase [Gemella sp. GH3.1]NYS50729.1 glucosamine-6-phosphate isomerase [Gemella sp. GH3]
MKYVVCNSENAVYNRVYDELERYIEDGAVFSFSESLIGTQFTKRMIDEYKNGKYKYNHIIFLGQKEFTFIQPEEESSFYKLMKKNLYLPLNVDYKNIFYPKYFDNQCIEDYRNILEENLIDVVILTVNSLGEVLNYTEVTNENNNIHIYKTSAREKNSLRQKYNLTFENDIISIGYDNIMNARNIFLVVLGKDKRKYVEKIFEEEKNNNEVLSLLKTHNNLTVFVDKDAGYKTEEEVNRLIKAKNRKKAIEEIRHLEK